MSITERVAGWFGRGKRAPMKRSYAELASTGGSDWVANWQAEDAELLQNAWAVIPKTRDLFRCNPLYIAYRETLWSNVFGANGIMLRCTIKEEEDRVIHTPEKGAIEAHYARQDKLREFLAKDQGREYIREQRMRIVNNTDGSERAAHVKIGEPDVFANTLIERKWSEFQRAEFCDVRGTRNYKTMRQLRLLSAVRDGDFFIHLIADARVNKFGFTMRMLNSEWCDRFYNDTLENGNIVVMGIEYQWTPWGIGKVVAYHFIKRQQRDWRYTFGVNFGMFGPTGRGMHDRIPAEEIIHYARATDADSTRPAPWVATTIPSSRQRDQAMLAEVIAWREAACKSGHYYSDIVPEGGTEVALPDPTGVTREQRAPGEWVGLPYGVKAQANDPHHPNANVKEFRMASIQDGCAGMPGSNYSTMANDYAAINFSAGRLQRLDTNETNMLLQQFDIDYAETPIFEKWLEMALTTGAIPLPLAKLEKFNRKVFTARRWRGVDEVKEATAAALRVANHQSNDFIECSAMSLDFEDVITGQSEANMLKTIYGIAVGKTVESGAPPVVQTPEESDAADAAETSAATARPSIANNTGNGKHKPALDKHRRIELKP